ncbi:helix-turn-helix domain-containing protein [Pseudarthrobacter defluvii]|uniref:helix-turn-helix domain-containing protein n=1 Tax=Pseudarthrobacter defluvii TaxID=410837 RepID=UPI0025771587|nr:XRE family transcriptional regulator [Pseudarthrobacter defluvii]WJH25428.1 XRE family transcriptional regulator [Pseudarthrobacter defluvii]
MNGIGDVILAARQAAGITQQELREALGVTQAALSRYENNLRTPDDETLAKLGEALRLSPDFLNHSFRLQGAIAADAHMRRQKSTKASDWKRMEARLNLLRMQSSYLFERLPMQAENHVPTFDPDSVTPAEAAGQVRAQWRLPIGPVRNLVRWIEAAGVLVIEEDFGTRRMDGLSQWASEYPVILLNASLPTDRKRLTLAHELGHLVLHSNYADLDMEEQANQFAAEFLMPERAIYPSLGALTLGKLVDLKQEWGVSMQALFERAYRLGRATGDDRLKFYKAMNARGWKANEPGSDELPPEEASLAASIGSNLQSNGFTSDEIASLVGQASGRDIHPFVPVRRGLRAVS